MRFSIHHQRNTDGENQHPGHDIAKHKRTACQYDAQQGNCGIGWQSRRGGRGVCGGPLGAILDSQHDWYQALLARL